MDYGEVLSKSWQIIWKHKVLWIFGILAGCARGGGGGGGNGGGGTRTNQPFGSGVSPQAQQSLTTIEEWIRTHPDLVVLAIVLFVVFVLLLAAIRVALGTIGEIGLIKGVQEADGGAERLHFGELFKESLHYFWRVLALSLLVGFAFFVVILAIVGLAIAGALVTLGTTPVIGIPFVVIGAMVVLLLLCVLFPVGVLVAIVIQLADIAIVSTDSGIREGVRQGWELFKKELGPVLVIWLITIAIELVVGLVIAVPIIVVTIPAFLAVAFNSGNFSWTPLIIAGACLVAYLPILLVATGILLAYVQSVWTLTYLRLTRSPAVDPTAPALPANA